VLRAIVPVVAEHGYFHTKIADIAEQAGISRATFYELFPSKEQCLLAAHRRLADEFHVQHEAALDGASAGGEIEASLELLVKLAREEPAVFELLTHDVTLAGPAGGAERERLLAQLVATVADRLRGKRVAAEGAPELPLRLLIGGAVRLIGMRLRSASAQLPALAELVEWTSLYAGAGAGTRWREFDSDGEFARETLEHDPVEPFIPQAPPRGRHGLPAAVVRRVQRDRVLHATAAAMAQKGYAETTVADIVATAGLSREVFYAHLHSRREALEEATKVFFEQTFARMAGAFFTAPASWPDRVWAAGLALTRFLVAAPSFTRLVLIESYAPDADAARRADELLLAFAMFVRVGFEESEPEGAAAIPAIVPEAVVSVVIEAISAFVQQQRIEELPGLVPLGTYLTLAPFAGGASATALVDAKIAELRAS
jgi:AcrR family transcriptional regulator